MKEVIIESYGKINLGLDVLYKREDGYHEIRTIMQQISLRDTLTLEEIKEGIVLSSNNNSIPLDSSNLAYKAWEKIKEKTGINKGININIRKNIPVSAGLAGGSSNAAAVLKGLNELWELGLNHEELIDIGVQIGADVPFCIVGGTALAEGIGEKLTKLKPFTGKSLLLVNPGICISTAETYKKLKLQNKAKIDIKKIMSFIESDNLISLSKSIINVMEDVVLEDYPIVSEVKNDLIRYGALSSLMSGSGATVFGLFDDIDKLNYCKAILTKKYTKGTVVKSHTI